MIHHQFSIYDQKAKAYLPPFILPEIEMAERTFGDCINSDDHQFGKHPEDYTLFNLGLWDDSTAKFTPAENGPHPIGNGVEFVRPHQSEKYNGQEQSIPEISNESPIQQGATSDDS